MTVVAFFSGKGAPGATTTALVTGALWPRPALVADCDPAGGDVALRLSRPDGRPLDLSTGMLSLLPVARRALAPDALAAHAQEVAGGGRVLAGMNSPEQATAGGPVWATIAEAFSRLDSADVIVDVGRLHSRSPVLPLVTAARLAVLVIDHSLASVYTARARLRGMVPILNPAIGAGPRLGLVVRGKDPREAEATAEIIQSEFRDVVYLGRIAEDATGAGIFDGRPVARPERTLLVRSAGQLVDALQRELGRTATVGADATPEATPTTTAPTDAPAEARRSRVEERREARRAGGGLLRRRAAERSSP